MNVLITLRHGPGYFSLFAVCCVAAKEVVHRGKTQSQRGGKAPKTGRPLGGRYTTEHAPGTDKAIYRDVLGRIQEETKVELKQVIEQEKTVD